MRFKDIQICSYFTMRFGLLWCKLSDTKAKDFWSGRIVTIDSETICHVEKKERTHQMNSDNRDIPQSPLTRFKRYRKFGFVLTDVQMAYCPSCKTQLNAGPNYVPERCSKCGQLID